MCVCVFVCAYVCVSVCVFVWAYVCVSVCVFMCRFCNVWVFGNMYTVP